jgi:predicted nucleic acid-binding protein
MTVLVDANVLLDVLTGDPVWASWSLAQIERWANDGPLAINPIIYAEVSAGFQTAARLDKSLPEALYVRLPLPYAAAHLAGQVFRDYRRAGGVRRSPLPDFYIGAHAMVEQFGLLTRDVTRYRTYFPKLRLIAPD